MLRRFGLMRISGFLLDLAPSIVYSTCTFLFIGEPKVPEKLKRLD